MQRVVPTNVNPVVGTAFCFTDFENERYILFHKGDKIFYGQTGVCVVEDVSEKVLTKNLKKLYYTLRPVYQQNNIIYAPVESDKVFMRKVISKDTAERLIRQVPELCEKALEVDGEEDYKACLESHSCEELLELAVKIYSKKQAARRIKKKLGFIDEKYLRRAEELLFGELSIALGVSPDEVPGILFEGIKG